MLETGQEIHSYWQKLRADRYQFEDVWQKIADNMLGMRDFNQTHWFPGRERMRVIYDTTGLNSGKLLAGSLHGILTNPAGRWHDISLADKDLLGFSVVADWISHLNTITDHVFKDARFMFPTAIAEAYLDYVFFGTCAVYVEDKPGFGPLFSSHALGEVYIDVDAHGRVSRIFRRFRLTRIPTSFFCYFP